MCYVSMTLIFMDGVMRDSNARISKWFCSELGSWLPFTDDTAPVASISEVLWKLICKWRKVRVNVN